MPEETFQGRRILRPKRRGPRVEGITPPVRMPNLAVARPRLIGPEQSLSDHLRHMASEEVLREGHNTLPTQAKAREMLRHGEARGHKLTRKQKGLLGLIAGGGKPTRMRRPK